jgi:hypothetical protein
MAFLNIYRITAIATTKFASGVEPSRPYRTIPILLNRVPDGPDHQRYFAIIGGMGRVDI